MNFFTKRVKKIASLYLLFPSIINFFKIALIRSGNKKIVVGLVQHLGDNVAAEPIDTRIKQINPDSFFIRIVGRQYAEVLRHNVNIDKIITVSCLSEWIYLKFILNFFYKTLDLHLDKSFCSKFRLTISNRNKYNVDVSNYFDYGNLLEIFCMSIGWHKINVKPRYWLPDSFKVPGLPQKFVVIQVSSNNSLKDWDNNKWLDLIKHINLTHNFPIIEVGLKSVLNCESPLYINYCGKLSLTAIAYTISRCELFIGIDSAFGHFANSFNIRKLVLLGQLNNFKHYLPYSGLTEIEETQSIIHYDGAVKHIPVGLVIEKVNLLLTIR